MCSIRSEFKTSGMWFRRVTWIMELLSPALSAGRRAKFMEPEGVTAYCGDETGTMREYRQDALIRGTFFATTAAGRSRDTGAHGNAEITGHAAASARGRTHFRGNSA
jgi:hypothetical protein